MSSDCQLLTQRFYPNGRSPRWSTDSPNACCGYLGGLSFEGEDHRNIECDGDNKIVTLFLNSMGFEIREVPDLSVFTALRKIDLSGNGFNRFPDSLRPIASQITYLRLERGAMLNSPFPLSVANMVNLEYVWMNSVFGGEAPTLAGLGNIKYCNLENNPGMCINYVNIQDFVNAQPRSCFNGFASMNGGRPCSQATAIFPSSNPPTTPSPSNPQPPPSSGPSNPTEPSPNNPNIIPPISPNPSTPTTRFVTVTNGENPATLPFLSEDPNIIIIIQTEPASGGSFNDDGSGLRASVPLGSSGTGTIKPSSSSSSVIEPTGVNPSPFSNPSVIVPVAVGIMAVVVLFPVVAFVLGRARKRKLARDMEKDLVMTVSPPLASRPKDHNPRIDAASPSASSMATSIDEIARRNTRINEKAALFNSNSGSALQADESVPAVGLLQPIGKGGGLVDMPSETTASVLRIDDAVLYHGIDIAQPATVELEQGEKGAGLINKGLGFGVGLLTSTLSDSKVERSLVEQLPPTSLILEDPSLNPLLSHSRHRIVSKSGRPIRRRIVLNVRGLATSSAVAVITSPTLVNYPSTSAASSDSVSEDSLMLNRDFNGTRRGGRTLSIGDSMQSSDASGLRAEVSLSREDADRSIANGKAEASQREDENEIEERDTSHSRQMSNVGKNEDEAREDIEEVVDVVGDPEEWTVDEVVMYLTRMGLPESVAVAFRDHSIDGRNLLQLTADDLAMELDIPATIILPCLSESAEYASSSVAPGDKLSPTITLDIHATLLKSIRALSQLQKEARALEEGSASGSGSDGLNHDDPALAPPQLWDTERICRWLGDDVGVGEDIVERFRAQRVTGQRLFNLTVRDMREEIGILPFGIRTTIHSAVDLLRRGDPSAVSDPTSLINSGNISGRVGIVPSYSAVAPPPYSRGS